jgi:hypothetical protein
VSVDICDNDDPIRDRVDESDDEKATQINTSSGLGESLENPLNHSAIADEFCDVKIYSKTCDETMKYGATRLTKHFLTCNFIPDRSTRIETRIALSLIV